jgi:hypothetical protein
MISAARLGSPALVRPLLTCEANWPTVAWYSSGQGGLGDVIDAPEVRLELAAEVLLARCLDRGDVRVAGVVDDDVHPPEPPQCSLER